MPSLKTADLSDALAKIKLPEDTQEIRKIAQEEHEDNTGISQTQMERPLVVHKKKRKSQESHRMPQVKRMKVSVGMGGVDLEV